MQNNSSFTDEQDKRSAASEENSREQQGEELWLPHETQLPRNHVIGEPSRERAAQADLVERCVCDEGDDSSSAGWGERPSDSDCIRMRLLS